MPNTFSHNIVHQQIEELVKIQPKLYIGEESDTDIELVGEILVDCKAKGFVLYDYYPVKIVIPINSGELPYIFDAGDRISPDYPHRYEDGRLCLETDSCIRIRFIDGFSLVEWMQEFVEPYYFSYEFFERYLEYPFGEHSHGIDGILETYQGLFHEDNLLTTLKLIKSICNDTYRGHLLCPCGSGKKYRKCHGPRVINYYTDKRLKQIIQADYNEIMQVLKEYNEQSRNQKEAK